MKIHMSFSWFYRSTDYDLGRGSNDYDISSFDEMKEDIREHLLNDGIQVSSIDIVFDDKIHIYADEVADGRIFDIGVYVLYNNHKFRVAQFKQDIFDFWHYLETYWYPDLD